MNVSFTGIQQVKDLKSAIKHQESARLVRSCKIGMFDGITLDEINSKEIQEALTKAKAKEIFDGGKRAYDMAINLLKEKFKS